MLVYGKNVFNELRANSNIRKAYISNRFRDNEIMEYIKTNKIKYEVVDENRLNKMEEGNHQGIIVEINDYEYKELETSFEDDFIVILDHLEDPHNFGAIIRTCEAAGINSVIIPKDRSVRVNATVMKTSSGALEHVNIIEVSNLVNAIDKLKDHDFFIYGAEASGKDYSSLDYAKKKVLVIGSEGNGVSRLVKENCDEMISIPMKGQVNSLNASVAAGILIYGLFNKSN